jgi:hypothetical protein
MDINYSYFNTAKGYKVVGGTAAQFLKADGSVDSNTYLPLSGGTMTGAINFSQGSVLQYNGSNRIRFGSTHTIISTDGTSDIYFRPKGDTTNISSMILSNNGNLSLAGGMYSGAGLSITQSNAGLGPYVGIELIGQTTERLYAGAVASTVGGYIGQAKYITSNFYQSNTTWASLLKFGNNGDIFFYGDTGLTPGTNYTPTELAKIDVKGKFTAQSIAKSGGTSSQFLKADGSIDSNSYFQKTNISGTLTDLNNLSLEGIYYGYQWANAPVNTIASVTIKQYSSDWIRQEFNIINGSGITYVRDRYNGNTWGDWYEIYSSNNISTKAITTNTNQTALTGDKSTTGIWTFGAPIEINKGTARISGNSYGAINTRMHPTDYSFWGNPTGALVIILPSELQYQNNIEIDIIDNQSNNLIQKLQVNAYEFISYSKASLINDTGSPDVVNRVRIGKLADNRSCIIINDINTAWSYPQMIVKKYVGGSLSIAKGTWTTQVMTDLSSVTIQQELTITKAVNSATLINKVSAVNSTYGLEWDGLQTYLRRNNNLEGYLYHSGNLNLANFAAANHTHTFASLTSKPTTLSGFGIADGMSTNHVANGITSAQISNWIDAYLFSNNFAANNPDLTAIETLSATDGYLRKDGNGQWSLTQATYTLQVASSSVFGGVKLINDTVQTAALDSLSSVAKRTYGVQMNPSKQMVVNVPWVNTTYSNGTGINLTGTQFSANFGTAAGTIAEGNDPRIINAIKLNKEFTINTDSGLILSDDYMGGESGIYDETYNMLLVGKENGLHKFGASYGGSGGVIVNPQSRHMGYGGVDPTDSHNHYFNGTIRITQGIYSESSNGNDLYAGSGSFYNLDEEIRQEDKMIRLAPFDKVFSGTNNIFATKNRVVKITLNDGGAIMMDEFFVNQEITIMNVSGDYATFIVNNTSIKVKIDPRSSATFYVNSENRIVMVRMDNDYCRILG